MIGAQSHFTLAEVAQLRGLTSKTVLNAIHAGELGAYRYSSRLVIIERPDLASWRMAHSAPPVIVLPRRERYYLQDIAVEFCLPVATVREAARKGLLRAHRVNARIVLCTPGDVASWRAECRRLALTPVTRGISGRATTFPNVHSSELATPAANAVVAA